MLRPEQGPTSFRAYYVLLILIYEYKQMFGQAQKLSAAVHFILCPQNGAYDDADADVPPSPNFLFSFIIVRQLWV
jgi:hypothetical protein